MAGVWITSDHGMQRRECAARPHLGLYALLHAAGRMRRTSAATNNVNCSQLAGHLRSTLLIHRCQRLSAQCGPDRVESPEWRWLWREGRERGLGQERGRRTAAASEICSEKDGACGLARHHTFSDRAWRGLRRRASSQAASSRVVPLTQMCEIYPQK